MLDRLVSVMPMPKNTGEVIVVNNGLTTQNIWFDDVVPAQEEEVPAWMQALNEQRPARLSAMAKMVMVLADKFNGDEWDLQEYSKHSGVQIRHKETGLYINAGSINAIVSLQDMTAINLSVTMKGAGTQMNLLTGAINYLCINVVNHHLDKKLALAEQGEFTCDYQEEELKEKAAAASQHAVGRTALFNSQVDQFQKELAYQQQMLKSYGRK